MENYPSNSRKTQTETAEPKKVEKVIAGAAVRRKKPLGRRLTETFIGGEDAQSVWGYVLHDVLVPAAKDTITDAFTQGIERMVFGDVRGRSGGSRAASRGGSNYTSYNRYSTPQGPSLRRPEPRQELSRRARATHDFDEIVLATKVEADEVIDSLFELITKYDTATVADLYEMVGQSGNFTDEKWGWTDIRNARATRVKGGYLLDLPKPEPLD